MFMRIRALSGTGSLLIIVACASCAASPPTGDDEPTGTSSAAYATSFAAPQLWENGSVWGAHGSLLGDVNRDGRKDIVALGNGVITVSTSNGSGFNAPTTWWNASFYGGYGTFLGDVDGDGRADLVGCSSGYVGVILSDPITGDSFGTYQTWYGQFEGQNGTLLGDVDGDGRADLIALNASTVTVALSTGTSFAPAVTWWNSPFDGAHGTLVGDVDGDGRADLVGLGNGYIGVILSNGQGFGGYQTWWNNSFYGGYGTYLGDVDNDGKADLVGLGGGYVGVIKSTGTGFGAYQTWSNVSFDEQYGSFLGDVDGDGNADLVGLQNTDVDVMLATGGGYQGGSGLGFHRPFMQIPDGGITMQSPQVVTILAQNDNSSKSDSPTYLNAFAQAFSQSATWAAVSNEYGVGTLSAVANVVGLAMASGSWTDDAIAGYVTTTVGMTWPPNGHRIYLIYLPAGSTLARADSCGFHMLYPGSTTDSIAVVQRCNPTPPQTQLDELTNAASHEVVESATDPQKSGGWAFNLPVQPGVTPVWEVYTGEHVEVADACEGTDTFESVGAVVPLNGWEFQRMWSNKAAAKEGDPCMPASSTPYFSVNVPQDWYAVSPGHSVAIPVAGWSASATGSWDLNRQIWSSAASTAFTIDDVVLRSNLGLGTVSTCGGRQEMTAGTGANLEVVAPVSAKSGDWVILGVDSFTEDPATCNPDAGQDHFHFWPVGVYVP
jgi:FG-GAP-like repeat